METQIKITKTEIEIPAVINGVSVACVPQKEVPAWAELINKNFTITIGQTQLTFTQYWKSPNGDMYVGW